MADLFSEEGPSELELAFLREILSQPDEDLPRLIYADWLEEQGELPRAELIRLQCEAARSTEDAALNSLRQSIEKLLDHHLPRWAGGLLGLGIHPSNLRFERGMIESLSFANLGMRILFEHHEEIFLRCPVLQSLDLNVTRILGNEIEQLARCESLYRFPLHRLQLRLADADNAFLLMLANTVRFPAITHLTLAGNLTLNHGLERLTRWPLLRTLHTLEFEGHGLGVAELTCLAHSSFLDKLRALKLRATALGDYGLDLLSSFSNLPSLSSLDFTGCKFGVGVVDSGLWDSRIATQLRELSLAENWLKSEAVQRLALAEGLRNLEVLNLKTATLDSPAVDALCGATFLQKLNRLIVSRDISEEARSRLGEHFGGRVRIE